MVKQAVFAVLCIGIIWAGGHPAASAQQPPAEVAAYTVVLEAPSVGERLSARESPGKREQFRRVDASSTVLLRRSVARGQTGVKQAIEAYGIDVLGSAQSVINALFVRCTSAQARALRAIPGVRRVVRSRTYRPALKNMPEIIRSGAVARQMHGESADGDGIKIAIIDSGIDPSHPAFQDTVPRPGAGSGTLVPLAGYPKGPEEFHRFANNKIVALRTYEHLLNTREPESSTPDENTPLDRNGHGTWVAMSAAGNRVHSRLGIVEGVAPAARIGVYKIYGTTGINDGASGQAVISSIDDAVADGMDVLNLSLGAETEVPWDWEDDECVMEEGGSRACNPDAVALNSAVQDFGVVAVVSAGNEGEFGEFARPTPGTLSAMSSIPDVLSVGATYNARRLGQTVQIDGTRYPAQAGGGPMPTLPLSAPGVMASDLDNATGCDFFEDEALKGRILIVAENFECGPDWIVENADAAGAAGVLVLTEAEDSVMPPPGLELTDIPAFAVGMKATTALRGRPEEAGELTVTLDPAPLSISTDAWEMAGYSSRGPTLRLYLKPDIVAPGTVYTATPRIDFQGNLHRPSGFLETVGTSFSAPVVAGAAALVLQANPDYTPQQVSSALINSANPNVREDGRQASLLSMGGGMLDVSAALAATTTVVPPTVVISRASADGTPEPPAMATRQVRITNGDRQTHSYRAYVERIRAMTCEPEITLNGSDEANFTLPRGQSATLQIAVDTQACGPGLFQGHIRLATGVMGGDLRIPYMYLYGDNKPVNAIVVPGFGEGTQGERTKDRVGAKIIDSFGAPVSGVAGTFSITKGNGRVTTADPKTNQFGFIFGEFEFDPETEEQAGQLKVGDLVMTFEFMLYPAEGGEAPQTTIEAFGMTGIRDLHKKYAPGSLINVFGMGLGLFSGEIRPGAAWAPVSLKSVSVSFDAPDEMVSAAGRLLRVHQDMLEVQVPWELKDAESAQVKSYGGGLGTVPVTMQLASTSPAILLSPAAMPGGSGSTPPPGLFARGETEVITPLNPARPGELINVVMTGNGPVLAPPPTGEASPGLNPTVFSPSVTVGGMTARVAYSSMAPGVIGTYAVGILVPQGLMPGMQPVVVTIDGVASNTASLAVQ